MSSHRPGGYNGSNSVQSQMSYNTHIHNDSGSGPTQSQINYPMQNMSTLFRNDNESNASQSHMSIPMHNTNFSTFIRDIDGKTLLREGNEAYTELYRRTLELQANINFQRQTLLDRRYDLYSNLIKQYQQQLASNNVTLGLTSVASTPALPPTNLPTRSFEIEVVEGEDPNEYDDVEVFWDKATWKALVEKCKRTQTTIDGVSNMKTGFLFNQKGKPITKETGKEMYQVMKQCGEELRNHGMAMKKFTHMENVAQDYCIKTLHNKFSVMRLCDNFWKPKKYLKARWSDWARVGLKGQTDSGGNKGNKRLGDDDSDSDSDSDSCDNDDVAKRPSKRLKLVEKKTKSKPAASSSSSPTPVASSSSLSPPAGTGQNAAQQPNPPSRTAGTAGTDQNAAQQPTPPSRTAGTAGTGQNAAQQPNPPSATAGTAGTDQNAAQQPTPPSRTAGTAGTGQNAAQQPNPPSATAGTAGTDQNAAQQPTPPSATAGTAASTPPAGPAGAGTVNGSKNSGNGVPQDTQGGGSVQIPRLKRKNLLAGVAQLPVPKELEIEYKPVEAPPKKQKATKKGKSPALAIPNDSLSARNLYLKHYLEQNPNLANGDHLTAAQYKVIWDGLEDKSEWEQAEAEAKMAKKVATSGKVKGTKGKGKKSTRSSKATESHQEEGSGAE
ncbi:hypothetical protein CC1G_10855 [Coprinopsis cinerea okayama7|uniref:Uncharacterized protein n=1 Tax=Coprinopsis cinerea (strain Okayama-7 / 130 / ATCC MYA-4618 / FGSC 9003) TaxID=240176 RepID=A8NKT0_COPC7|nr:hypothetical protein CC1G_10855 [Coprinopsis cinerea okayama7\|eukprot:XP_001834537.2 hypothetical protein CC1G_10855 [Coprinopsis cinerea okayama7\